MAMTVTYTNVNGRILSENRGGVVHHFISDPQGNVVMVRDTAGNTVYEAEYDPYGNVQSETGSNPSDLGYVGTLGYVTDAPSDIYVRARYLRPDLGRWLTKDPFWPNEPGFVYAMARPTSISDPTGKKPCAVNNDFDEWHHWNCEAPEVKKGYSELVRNLGKLCNPRFRSAYEACLVSSGVPATDASKFTACICSIQAGTFPIQFYCRPANNCKMYAHLDCIYTEPNTKPCKISICPDSCYGYDASTYGKAMAHEIGHCCGAKHGNPTPPAFHVRIHDECMVKIIGWGWIPSPP